MTEHEEFVNTTKTGGELPPYADEANQYEEDAARALANLESAISDIEGLHLYGDKDLARATRHLIRVNEVAQKPF